MSEKLGNNCIDFLKHNYKFKVGNNEPYGVNNNDDYIISKFGDKKSIPSIIIEIRQDLVSDYKGQKTWSDIIQNMIENCLYNYHHYEIKNINQSFLVFQLIKFFHLKLHF